jgi:hypothetical protein
MKHTHCTEDYANSSYKEIPGFASGQHVGFVMDKAALGQVFSEYFGFPCQTFHQFLHHHNHPGLAQWPITGRIA